MIIVTYAITCIWQACEECTAAMKTIRYNDAMPIDPGPETDSATDVN